MAGEQKNHQTPAEEGLIKRQRDGDKHAENCTTGYRVHGECNIHHIVCVTCMQDASIEERVGKEYMEFLINCLKKTEWDINLGHNNIGLPLNTAYYHKPDDKGWDNLPCHQVDHNRYWDAVSEYLHENVWAPLLMAREKCVFNPKTLANQLKSASTHYRSFLRERGQELGGTRHCWKNRPELRDAKGKLTGQQLQQWYIPFSMDPGVPRARRAPPEDEPASLKNLIRLLYR